MIILPANTLSTGGYEVANSCRFNDDDNARISKTFSSAGNSDTWTMSAWVKRCTLGANSSIFTCNGLGAGAQKGTIRFDSSDKISAYVLYAGSAWHYITSNAVYRDVSAWYHIVVRCDTTQSTDTDRLRLYVNGKLQTLSGSTYPDQNEDTFFNEAEEHQVGSLIDETEDGDMYLAEFCWIDGSSLAPTSFGEYDSDSPTIWKPIDVSGLTFGTNGVYLDFEDSSDLGKDASGNSDWTATNLAATDQATDTPTNNFATMNPLFARSDNVTFTEGNLKGALASEGNQIIASTIAVSAGKWFFEFQANAQEVSAYMEVGIFPTYHTTVTPNYIGGLSDGYSLQKNGYFYNNNSAVATDGPTYGTSDIMGVALDLDSGTKTIKYYKNGSLEDTYNITVTEDVYIGWRAFGSGEALSMNFGSPKDSISSGNSDGNGYGNFEYAVPSGYYSICTKNLAEFG